MTLLSFARIWALLAVTFGLSVANAQPAPLATPNLQMGIANGTINAVVALSDGGALIGGHFGRVNGLVRTSIARLNADGSLNTAWNATFNGYVSTMLVAGSHVYVGGAFHEVNGQPVQNLVRLSLADGSIAGPWTSTADNTVNALTTDGADLFVGGHFTTVGGQPRQSLARIVLADGSVSSWTNNVTNASGGTAFVNALAVDGGYLYVGGFFEQLAGQPHLSLGRVALGSSNSPDAAWTVAFSSSAEITKLAIFGPHLYVGGSFDDIGGIAQPYLARLSTSAGAAADTTWRPSVSFGVQALFVDSSGVLAAADFTPAGGPDRLGLGEVDLATGAVTTWDPTGGKRFSSNALAAENGAILSGQTNTLEEHRSSVVRLVRNQPADASYRVYAGNEDAEPTAIVHAPDGSTYIGGDFQGVEGLPISNLLRVKADGSLDTAWRPDPDAPVDAVALAGTDLIAGGTFTRIGGMNRNYLAKLGTGTTAVVDPNWDPNPDSMVSRIAVNGTDVFVAGTFSTIAGTARNRIAKLSSSGTGVPDPAWDAGWIENPWVNALALGNSSIYAAGYFRTAATGYDNLTKLSAATGARDPAWSPNADRFPSILALVGDQLFVGGDFNHIGGIQQGNLAKVNAITGDVDPAWMPQLSPVERMTHHQGVLYVWPTGDVSGISSPGTSRAISATTGQPDFTWTAGGVNLSALGARNGSVWAGFSGTHLSRIGLAAFPAAACVGQADNTSCDGGPGVVGATCQAAICTPPLAATTVSLSASPNPISPGTQITLTATVNSAGAPATGYVQFYNRDGYSEGSGQVNAGIATTTIDNVHELHTELVAIFEGSPQHKPSRSNTVNVTLLTGPASNDFNADGRPDLIWSNTASGATYIWRMNGVNLISDSLLATIDPIWKVQGVGDFNGDGHNDVVWRHTGNGNTYVWYLVNGVFQSDAFVFNLPPEWVIQGVADFNADGKPDFLMRNTNSGNAFAWFFNNNVAIGDQFLFNIDPSWKVEGVADLNADNQPDLLFRNVNSGLAFAWNSQFSGGNLTLTTSSPPIFSIDSFWEVVQVADWNNDNKPDLLFRNRNSGVVFVWYMDGITLTTSDFIIQIDPSWEIVPRR